MVYLVRIQIKGTLVSFLKLFPLLRDLKILNMNMIKAIFYNYKIKKNHTYTDDEAMKQWVLKIDKNKNYDKDKDLINKAKLAIDEMLKGNKPKDSDLSAYLTLRKKYQVLFKENNSELENPSADDVISMDSISLNEVKETIDDSKKTLLTKYYNSILEIYRSSDNGVIVRPTSGGLYKSKTPTNDFIDDQTDFYNPFDDTGLD